MRLLQYCSLKYSKKFHLHSSISKTWLTLHRGPLGCVLGISLYHDLFSNRTESMSDERHLWQSGLQRWRCSLVSRRKRNEGSLWMIGYSCHQPIREDYLNIHGLQNGQTSFRELADCFSLRSWQINTQGIQHLRCIAFCWPPHVKEWSSSLTLLISFEQCSPLPAQQTPADAYL